MEVIWWYKKWISLYKGTNNEILKNGVEQLWCGSRSVLKKDPINYRGINLFNKTLKLTRIITTKINENNTLLKGQH